MIVIYVIVKTIFTKDSKVVIGKRKNVDNEIKISFNIVCWFLIRLRTFILLTVNSAFFVEMKSSNIIKRNMKKMIETFREEYLAAQSSNILINFSKYFLRVLLVKL